MSNKSVQKKAEADAAEYAAAYMAIGEGAGNRRKHIETTVEYQMKFVPGYAESFDKAHSGQDMVKHVEKARKENQRRERSKVASRNTKAVLSGDMKNADLKVIALIAVGALAHQKGLDKKALDFGKRKVADFKRKHKKTHATKPDADGVFHITDV